MTTDWQRRHALQIASQLPDGLEDALAVLAYAKEITSTSTAVVTAAARGSPTC
jgi:hypothetical protein